MLFRGPEIFSTEVASYLPLIQQPRVRFPAFLNFFTGRISNDAEVNQWRWLEESGHWLENVDLTHLVLAGGKPVLQEKIRAVFNPPGPT